MIGMLAVIVILALLGFSGVEAQEGKLPTFESVGSAPKPADASQSPLASSVGREHFLEALREAQVRDARRTERLASPESVEDRERSKAAFVGLADTSAIGLLETTFGADLKGTAVPDLQDISDGRRVERFIDDRTVVLAGTEDRPPILVELPRVAKRNGCAGS